MQSIWYIIYYVLCSSTHICSTLIMLFLQFCAEFITSRRVNRCSFLDDTQTTSKHADAPASYECARNPLFLRPHPNTQQTRDNELGSTQHNISYSHHASVSLRNAKRPMLMWRQISPHLYLAVPTFRRHCATQDARCMKGSYSNTAQSMPCT
jgi:hypothetical protein